MKILHALASLSLICLVFKASKAHPKREARSYVDRGTVAVDSMGTPVYTASLDPVRLNNFGLGTSGTNGFMIPAGTVYDYDYLGAGMAGLQPDYAVAIGDYYTLSTAYNLFQDTTATNLLLPYNLTPFVPEETFTYMYPLLTGFRYWRFGCDLIGTGMCYYYYYY